MAGDERGQGISSNGTLLILSRLIFRIGKWCSIILSESFKQFKSQAPNTWRLNCYSLLKWVDQGVHLTLLIGHRSHRALEITQYESIR